MSKNKIVKSVSFNITDQQDQVYLERIAGVNFSGYVKKLIEKDIKTRKIIKSDTTTEAHTGPSAGPILIKGNTSLKMI